MYLSSTSLWMFANTQRGELRKSWKWSWRQFKSRLIISNQKILQLSLSSVWIHSSCTLLYIYKYTIYIWKLNFKMSPCLYSLSMSNMSQNIFPGKLQVTFCIDYYYKEYTSKVAQLFFTKYSVSLYLRCSNFTNVFLLNHVNFFQKCVSFYI